jgi:tetratricopeptide (TPR) repeat protein
VLVIASTFNVASSQNIDSLKALLLNNSRPERTDIFFELSKASIDLNKFVDAKEFAWEGLQLAQRFTDTSRIVKLGRVFGTSLRRMGFYDSSIAVYQSFLPLAERVHNLIEHELIVAGLANSYLWKGSQDKALYFYLEALSISQQLEDTGRLSISHNNLGVTYYKLRDYKKSILHYAKSIELKKKTNDNYDLALALVNLGLCYQAIKEYENAEKNILEGLALCKDDCSPYVEINGFMGLGLINSYSKKYCEAETYLLRSFHAAKRMNDPRYMIDNISALSKIYLIENRTAEALNYLKKADSIGDVHPAYYAEMRNVYESLYQWYEKINDLKRLAYYQQKYIQATDSVFDGELISNLMRVQADFVTRENETKLRAKEEVLLLKENIITNQKRFNVVSVILIIVFIFLLIAVWVNFRRRKKMNEILDIRLRERSEHFNLSRDKLIKELEEKQSVLDHASADIQNTLDIMQRLSFAAQKEISEPGARGYFLEMEKNRSKLAYKIITTFASQEKIYPAIEVQS